MHFSILNHHNLTLGPLRMHPDLGKRGRLPRRRTSQVCNNTPNLGSREIFVRLWIPQVLGVLVSARFIQNRRLNHLVHLIGTKSLDRRIRSRIYRNEIRGGNITNLRPNQGSVITKCIFRRRELTLIHKLRQEPTQTDKRAHLERHDFPLPVRIRPRQMNAPHSATD